MDSRNETLDTILERGEIVLNGYKFTVKPVYFGEESEYLQDVPIPIYPQAKEKSEITDKDLSRFGIMLFIQDMENADGKKLKKKLGLFQRIKRWWTKKFVHDYRYYSDNPSILGLVKWIERKVYYKGHPIRFYDLERKFHLSKSEIVKLFGFFQDNVSGF